MKILHVIPSVSERSGGPGTAIVPMCRALMHKGIEVQLSSTSDGLTEKPDVVEYKGVPAMFFPPQLGASFKYSRPLATWLNANVKNFDLAHIHAVFNHSSMSASQACRKAGVPYGPGLMGDPSAFRMSSGPRSVHFSPSGEVRRCAMSSLPSANME